MTLEDIKTMLEGITGFSKKVAYRAFPENEAPPLPFICYLETETNNFAADGIVYLLIKRVDIELYSRLRDISSETKIENALKTNGIFWDKSVDYIDTEKCYMITYTIEV